jgi:hypothetical protein
MLSRKNSSASVRVAALVALEIQQTQSARRLD